MEYDNITKKELLDWLGSDNTKDEALSVILDIVNGNYPVHVLFNDIVNFSRKA